MSRLVPKQVVRVSGKEYLPQNMADTRGVGFVVTSRVDKKTCWRHKQTKVYNRVNNIYEKCAGIMDV